MSYKPSYKQACEVIRAHYQVNTKTPRKLMKLFQSDLPKNDAIVGEAKRILAFRESLGAESHGAVCEMCECYGSERHIYSRETLTLKIDNRQLFSGWKKWNIDQPTLCRMCAYRARSVVAQYNDLIDLYRLCNKLINARADHE